MGEKSHLGFRRYEEMLGGEQVLAIGDSVRLRGIATTERATFHDGWRRRQHLLGECPTIHRECAVRERYFYVNEYRHSGRPIGDSGLLALQEYGWIDLGLHNRGVANQQMDYPERDKPTSFGCTQNDGHNSTNRGCTLGAVQFRETNIILTCLVDLIIETSGMANAVTRQAFG